MPRREAIKTGSFSNNFPLCTERQALLHKVRSNKESKIVSIATSLIDDRAWISRSSCFGKSFLSMGLKEIYQ